MHDDHLLHDLLDLAVPTPRPRTTAGRVAAAVAALGAALLGAGGCWPDAPASPAPAVTTTTSEPFLPELPAAPVPTTVPPTSPAPAPADAVVAYALAQVGRPYVRGAAGPDAFDCSGLVVAAYRQAGIELPHWSVAQAEAGRGVDPAVEPLRPGDLVFTRGDTPEIDLGHVGIALDGERWVSAPRPGGQVHVVPIPWASVQRVRRLVG